MNISQRHRGTKKGKKYFYFVSREKLFCFQGGVVLCVSAGNNLAPRRGDAERNKDEFLTKAQRHKERQKIFLLCVS
jgi:hypothetical protein